MTVRPLVPAAFNRKGSNNPFLASLGLDTYDGGLRRGRRRDYPQQLEPKGRVQGAMMEKGYPPLSGLEPSLWYFPFMTR